MELIKPSQISGEIMTLIEEADQYLILVSPYCKINKWYKLLKRFDTLKQRKIDLEFYVRQGEKESIDEIRAIGITPIEIPNLHCKLYLNEKYGIVSSMNLLLSSEINSLEIAYKTTTKEEYDELLQYYSRYLKRESNYGQSILNNFDWREYLYEGITSKSDKTIRINEDFNNIKINTGLNNYEAFIAFERKSIFRISGILSGREYDMLKKNKNKININEALEVELVEGGKGYYNTIRGESSKPIKSRNLNELAIDEEKLIADFMIDFVVKVDALKKSCR